jgi:hypothetical protein
MTPIKNCTDARFRLACAYIELRDRGLTHEELVGLRIAMKEINRTQRASDKKLSSMSKYPWITN